MKAVEGIAKALWHAHYAVRQLGTVEDVAAYGMIGLLEAARRFDRGRGFKLATFAASRIRGAIFDEARNSGIIKTPRLAQQRGEPAKQVGGFADFLWGRGRDGEQQSLHEPATREPRRDDGAAAVESFLQTLSRRERSIVRLYFGMVGGHSLTMKQVGQLHGMSESRVSQLMSDILKRASEHRGIRALERRIRR